MKDRSILNERWIRFNKYKLCNIAEKRFTERIAVLQETSSRNQTE